MAKSVSERTATAVARLTTDAQSAAHMQDVLAECLDSESVAVSRTEEPDGRWSLALHFREQPNESAVRALIAAAMKGATAPALQFETLAATDWVRESRLPPVEAGRFVVHGAHDRARVPVNRIGIEIEAGLPSAPVIMAVRGAVCSRSMTLRSDGASRGVCNPSRDIAAAGAQ